MRRLRFFLLLALALALPLTAQADGPAHVVAYGETLYSIARQYGVSPTALADANGLTTQSWVYAGQRLMIPGQSAPTSSLAPASASPSGIYVVRAGDTLYSLSRRFGVSVSALADANNIPPNGVLYTGWQLKIPGANAAASPPPSNNAAPANANAAASPPRSANSSSSLSTSTYIVQPGDNLFRIAIRAGVTMQAIVIANNLTTQFVYSGQRLTIPGSSNVSASSPAPAVNSPANAAAAGARVGPRDIPVYKQKQTLTCEEAAAAMALKGAVTEAQLVAAMPRSDNPFEGIRGDTDHPLYGGLTHYGTYAHGLQKGLAKLGHPSTAYYGQPYATFKQTILDNLKAGRAVIWWTTWHESYQRPETVTLSTGVKITLTPYEHTVVIVSANDSGVTYNDPYDGTVRFTSWTNHERTSGYFGNMALIVF